MTAETGRRVVDACASAAGRAGVVLLPALPLAVVSRVLFSVSGWCCLVALLGLLDRPRAPRPGDETPAGRGWLYAYLAAAALPFYVLHQPIVAASLILIFAAYDILVRRTRLTRFLFGMRAERT
jgi:glucan biosynthesis protein C